MGLAKAPLTNERKVMKTIDIKGKPYVEVNERIKHFWTNEHYNGHTIQTEILSHLCEGEENIKAIIFKATICDIEGRVLATGHAREKDGDGYINKTSYVENCETSAIGRALGCLGIGIDTSVASADEVTTAVNNQDQKSAPPAKPKPKAPRTLFWNALQAKAQDADNGVKPSELTKPVIHKIIADIAEGEGVEIDIDNANDAGYNIITRKLEDYNINRAVEDFKAIGLIADQLA
jgi:hypothetical protein